MTFIEDPTSGTRARVTADENLGVESQTQLISGAKSKAGKLFGLGTGAITPTDSFSLGSVLWFRNDAVDENIRVQKIIWGWDGGSTNFNRTIFSLIYYKTGAPSANNTEIDDAIENISLTGSAAVKSGKILAYKWDGVGTGMTTGSGGFAQIGNRLAQGDTSRPIDGEIILGPGDAMEFRVTPQQTGLFNVAVVYWFEGIND